MDYRGDTEIWFAWRTVFGSVALYLIAFTGIGDGLFLLRSFLLREACPNPHPQETVELLQAKVNALDLAVLDQVEARLQVLSGGQTGLQVS